MAHAIVYDPLTTPSPLQLKTYSIPTLLPSPDSVIVQFLASPVNRVDLMLLAGQYPVKPTQHLSSSPIPGFDGCGTVLASASPSFSPGDIVLPRDLGLGTWRSHAVLPASSLLKLPAGTPPLAGALLRSGAVIAWLLLEEIRQLAEGDTIIMSAGTSTVAQFLIQLARLKGISVILVIRDREASELENTKKFLRERGATAVLSETELEDSLSGKIVPSLLPESKPKLALDCVFGPVGKLLAETLAPGGTFVLVGLLGGAGASIQVGTKDLFVRQLSFVPFRGSEVLKRMGESKTTELFQKIATLFIEGHLKIPEIVTVRWKQENEEALEETLKGAVEKAKSNGVGYRKIVFLP